MICGFIPIIDLSLKSPKTLKPCGNRRVTGFLMVESVGISRCQGSSTGCAGARGVLDRGFPGVFSTLHPDPNPPYALDVGSIPSYSSDNKRGSAGPSLLSGELREIRTLVQKWLYALQILHPENHTYFSSFSFSDFSHLNFYFCVGLYGYHSSFNAAISSPSDCSTSKASSYSPFDMFSSAQVSEKMP